MLKLTYLLNTFLVKSQTTKKYSSSLDISHVTSTCISNPFLPIYTFQTKVCGFHTSDRTVIAASKSHSKRKHCGTLIGQCELDSHADTTVAGGNCCVLHYTGRECDVFPYSEDYKPVQGVPIVTAGTAWQSPFTGQTYILVFNEALHMPSLPNTLINPNQLRYFGTWVQDNPVLDSPLHLRTEDASFSMPLEMRGTTIFAVTQTPTEHELNTCPRIILSSPHQWNPSTVQFPQSSKSLEQEIQDLRMDIGISRLSTLSEAEYFNESSSDGALHEEPSISPCSCEKDFCSCSHRPRTIANLGAMNRRLISQVHVTPHDVKISSSKTIMEPEKKGVTS